jgi:N-acetylglucosamine kinase-like BadF-type ATPase
LNPNHAGAAASAATLVSLLSDLRMRMPGAPDRLAVDAACVGLSGVSNPSSRSIVQEAFRTAEVPVAGPRILVGDADLVLEEAFGPTAPSGVVVIAGTGSIAMARDRSGAIVRAGGLGPGRGDFGGGHWVGGRGTATGLVAREEGGAARDADFAREVVRRAARGDTRAVAILAEAAAHLADLVAEVAARAGLGPGYEVRPSGGLVTASAELRRALAERLAALEPRGTLLEPVRDPVRGALKLASRALATGSAVPPGW